VAWKEMKYERRKERRSSKMKSEQKGKMKRKRKKNESKQHHHHHVHLKKRELKRHNYEDKPMIQQKGWVIERPPQAGQSPLSACSP
jgi:hypothetical protein